jgi:hypothetical protein
MCCDSCCSRPEPVDEHELRAAVERAVVDFDFLVYDADVIATADSMDARLQLWRPALADTVMDAVLGCVSTA